MKFKEYQHIERLGTTVTEDIEFGTCYIFITYVGEKTHGFNLKDDSSLFLFKKQDCRCSNE